MRSDHVEFLEKKLSGIRSLKKPSLELMTLPLTSAFPGAAHDTLIDPGEYGKFSQIVILPGNPGFLKQGLTVMDQPVNMRDGLVKRDGCPLFFIQQQKGI
jgi:hypothetical protein